MLAIFTFTFVPAKAQEKDFALWSSFEFEKKLTKGFDVEVEAGHRIENNLSQRDETFAGLSLSYSKKKVAFAVGYRLTNDYNRKRTYDWAHRIALQANYKPEIKRVTINYRIRIQAQYSAVNTTPEGYLPTSFLRNRLKVSYNVKGIPLEPALSYELFTRINSYAESVNERKRLEMSLSYKVFKNNEVKLSLIRHETYNIDSPKAITVLGLGYKINL